MPDHPEPLFSGMPSTPSPEVFERARKGNPAWYQIFEQAYEQFARRPENAGIYADPKGKGATIQQVWHFFTLFRVETYCLLARPLPASSTQRITRLVHCTPAELVSALVKIQAAEGQVNVPLAYHDGTIGHCIRITDHDSARDRFVYHDPWPERSLLARENNAAGVDAQPEGQRWSVTRQELERVVFAAFVFPRLWARVQGTVFDLFHETWTKSEFFRFFHLKLQEERIDGETVRRAYAPGPFKDAITLQVDCRPDGKIVRAALGLAPGWIIDNFPLALDLVKSFIGCFAPPPDQARYAQVAAALWSLRDPRALIAAQGQDPEKSEDMRCVHTFMGSIDSADVATDFAHLRFGAGKRGDQALRLIEFTLL